ncbi:MAG: hypothetical protein CM1200mP10_26700 [Candidatus Neomarinimicrobiota bacterium]|nr:MAG: hypothetical protein CM1200mP10_26700 [Candidatus Neomarinimicrobiota bacterium]
MEHRIEIDENLVEGQRTRRVIDRLVGYKISLYYGLHCRKI